MTEKIQKILANRGLGSRRQIELWIQEGRVTVNGELAKLGDRVGGEALICVDGEPVRKALTSAQLSVLMYYKPEGEICTRSDPKGRTTVFQNLPEPPSGRWVMVGRLDYNTSGLLLFTNNGEFANKLMHPAYHLPRVYAVRVYGVVQSATLAILKKGVMLEDGLARFDVLEPMGGERSNQWYQVTISMGRNRIVRRLWESQGLKVNRLKRLSFGAVSLPRTLKPGTSLLLSPQEIESLSSVV